MREGSSARAFYTDARLALMRRNVERYEWARAMRDDILKQAERWAAYDDEQLRTLVIPPEVPRGYDVHNFGCPVHGVKANEKGFYQWGIDFDRPFKIRCPAGGEEYPSNDFEAYLRSGLKDRSLLTGPYADDGWGWHRPDEGPDMPNYWFVAYYAHWSMHRFLLAAIQGLGTACVLVEDPAQAGRYAHKGGLLLWQLAKRYPDYIYNIQSREGREHNPNYTGRLFNMISAVQPPNTCAPAYDAVRPFLLKDRALQALAGLDGAELDEMIRERLLREAARDVLDGSYRIAGNYGMHQKTLIALARVLGDGGGRPGREEMIRYVADNPGPRRENDVGFRDALENLIYRDGLPHESPGYNLHWTNELAGVAEGLAEFGINFFDDPRFRRFLAWPFNACVAGRFTPPTGDTGDMFGQVRWPLEAYRKALPFLRDLQLGWAVRTGEGESPFLRKLRLAWSVCTGEIEGRDLFEPPVEEILSDIGGGPQPEIGHRSYLLPAYGLSNLQSGGPGRWVASCLFYGSHTHHMHHDQLNLLLFGFDNALLTDFGYPEQTDSFNHRRYGYFNNTVAHNTVVVDAVKQGRGPGRLHAFESHGFAQVVDASCERAYADRVTLYRRANVHVEAAPGQSYLFDVFYVRGGRQHDWAAHGPQAEFACAPDLGTVQAEGTLAGQDVPYEQFYDDPNLKDKPLGSVPCSGYRGSGYQFLRNVQRAGLDGDAVCDWRLTEPKEGQPERPWQGIGLRAHLMGSGEEVIACDGPVQHYKYLPESVKFVIRRRTGEDLSSAFGTVFEPYQGHPWIRRVTGVSISPDNGQASAALVELEDGGRHYLFHALTPDRSYTLDGGVQVAGQAACLALDAEGRPEKAMLLNGTDLRMGDFSLKGRGLRRSRIVSVDYAAGVIEIADPLLDGDLSPGQVILVAPEAFSDSVTVQKVIDRTHLSVGDEDLRVAGGPVSGVRSVEKEILTPVSNPHAQAGMTVINSRREPRGRLCERTRAGWRLDLDRPLKPEDFPPAEGERTPRFSVVLAGPGDEVAIPHLSLFERR